MDQGYSQKPSTRIVRRLIVLIVLFSATITLVISVIQLYNEYTHDISLIDSRFSQVEDANLKSLTNALWVADAQDMETQLQGLLRLPDMQYIEIRDQHRVWAAVGEPSSKNTISHTYKMTQEYRGQTYNIGTLKVVATLEDVYSRLVRQAVVILVSNGIKTFLVAGFIIYIFQYLVTRHLVKIAEFAGGYKMSESNKVLELDRKERPGQETDELGVLVTALNQMQANLRQTFEALRENERRLTHQQAHLEELVKERTASLEAAQETLVRNERLATLGQLTATVSHELRNPLNAMQPSLYILKNSMDPEDIKVRESVERIERNLKRCDRIIDELLDFTRITTLEFDKVNVDDWLKNVISELEIDPRIKIRWDLNLAGVVHSFDSERMRRAVANLVTNACQAMLLREQGQANDSKNVLSIQTKNAEQRLEIKIGDTGPGISPEILDKVFEPLFSTKNFGVGLGMSIVRQIMKLHQGGIEINSIPEEGTTIILWLPKSS